MTGATGAVLRLGLVLESFHDRGEHVLRPDGFIAWRSAAVPPDPVTAMFDGTWNEEASR